MCAPCERGEGNDAQPAASLGVFVDPLASPSSVPQVIAPLPCTPPAVPQGVTALFVASAEGHLPAVQALAVGGADLNVSSPPDSPLDALTLPRLRTLPSTLESAAVLAFTPLQAAAAFGHTAVTQYLCARVRRRAPRARVCVCACANVCV